MTVKISLHLIEKFDAFLFERNLVYAASIVGGTAILLIANSSRPTGDIDSISKIPPDIKKCIANFAVREGISPTWFNDNVSRNFFEYATHGENVFDQALYFGQALKLYAPSKTALLLSKFHPLVDRPGTTKDLDDIDSLIDAGVINKNDFQKALEDFRTRIRFEEESEFRRRAWAVERMLSSMMELKFYQLRNQ